MSGFSDDCRWWWDGQRWLPTSEVVLPQLPPTEIELSGKLALARADLAKGRPGFWKHTLFLEGLLGFMPVNRRGLSEYRTWTMEQLALAAAYLLGPDEPMLAGEMSRHDVWDGWARNLAVAVTAAHVIVFRIDYLDGQPRWVGMAAPDPDVRLDVSGAGGQRSERAVVHSGIRRRRRVQSGASARSVAARCPDHPTNLMTSYGGKGGLPTVTQSHADSYVLLP